MSDVLNVRILLLMALFFLGMTLYGTWQEEHAPVQQASSPQTQQVQPVVSQDMTVPHVNETKDKIIANSEVVKESAKIDPSRLIYVETDLLKLQIDRKGGDIVYAELKQYPKEKGNEQEGFVLLDHEASTRYYIAQTGLASALGPDSRQQGRAVYTSSASTFKLGASDQDLQVVLNWTSSEGVQFKKIYKFEANSYLIKISYEINNSSDQTWQGRFYGQLQRTHGNDSKKMMGMNTYMGGALYTPEKKFKKVSFSDMDSKGFQQTIKGGWAAMVEHYFLSAWVPNQEAENEYFTSVVDRDKYSIGSMSTVQVPAHGQSVVQGEFYLGPEIAENLEGIAPGLELTIDYGILWPISQVIFYVLKKIHHFVGNWGWSIILVTILIKALFFKLSATSYRSMGKLRKVQPKVDSLKQRYGDDKQKFSQAMMELYKKEKINPLGGCLPILVQIPVFIALYYVLLESVELRQAPFMLWIQDLSSRDPYYVLPLIMGATMLLQQKLSPAPPDPMQAKILMLMPIVFTVLFLTFPAGLVLYWVVNNVLSIAQQWIIMRKLEKEGIGHKVKAANSP